MRTTCPRWQRTTTMRRLPRDQANLFMLSSAILAEIQFKINNKTLQWKKRKVWRPTQTPIRSFRLTWIHYFNGNKAKVMHDLCNLQDQLSLTPTVEPLRFSEGLQDKVNVNNFRMLKRENKATATNLWVHPYLINECPQAKPCTTSKQWTSLPSRGCKDFRLEWANLQWWWCRICFRGWLQFSSNKSWHSIISSIKRWPCSSWQLLLMRLKDSTLIHLWVWWCHRSSQITVGPASNNNLLNSNNSSLRCNSSRWPTLHKCRKTSCLGRSNPLHNLKMFNSKSQISNTRSKTCSSRSNQTAKVNWTPSNKYTREKIRSPNREVRALM